MAKEIERKFIIDPKKWDKKGTPVAITQAYLAIDNDKIVRIRIAGEKAYITIKGKQTGITRDEFEYPIPVADARQMLGLCMYNSVEKTRYITEIDHKTWEIDVFHGKNEGLYIAEIELHSENELVNLPDWIVAEVSTDERYFNFNLSINPYCTWQ